jgi:hypothetical protein
LEILNVTSTKKYLPRSELEVLSYSEGVDIKDYPNSPVLKSDWYRNKYSIRTNVKARMCE